MAYINVDLDSLASAKKAVSDYCDKRKTIIGQMNNVVEGSANGWNADDQKAFCNQWNGMKSADGIFSVTGKELENYQTLLENALSIYKNAQSESVEQASKL